MSDKIPNLDLIPNSLGHMVLDEEQIVQVEFFYKINKIYVIQNYSFDIFCTLKEFW